MNFMFFLTSAMLGIGLAMDAFSVSLANGMNNPKLAKSKTMLTCGTFAFFQFAMPMIGWICVSTIAQYFNAFQKFIPWIALVLLCFIGGKMLYEGIKNNEAEDETKSLKLSTIIIQGIATSIDALSVGFTIANYNWLQALVCCLIIAVLTFFICLAGVQIGKKFGTKLSNKASILGGVILILIGLEIFITGII